MHNLPPPIKKGDIVQTKLYGHGKYLGRKVKVLEVQTDIEPSHETFKGISLRKDGSLGKFHHEFTRKELIN